MTPTQFFTAADGARLAYLDQGPRGALPLLCLSGLTRTKEDFDPALPALAQCRVIRMDYRGRGESAFTGAPSYTIAQEAADALALLDHLGLDQVGLLGTSRGGLIGLALLAIARRRLLGLCLVDIGPVIAPEGLAAIAARIGRQPSAPSFAAMADLLARNSAGFSNVPPEDWAALARRNYRQGAAGLMLNYDPALAEAFQHAVAAPAGDAWPLWAASVGLPVALIRGQNSDLLSPQTTARMQEMRPDLIFAEVPERGHVPFLNEAAAQDVLRQWIEALA